MVKVQLVSSPPQGSVSVSVSVSVVETSEVPVGIVKVTRMGVEETSEVLVGSIVAVTRVTPMMVEEAWGVLVGFPSLIVKVTLVTSATAIPMSGQALDDAGLVEGKKDLPRAA